MGNQPGGSSELAFATDEDIAGAGLGMRTHATVDELALAEARAIDPTEHEDATNRRKRAARTGTSESCTLPCERGMPGINAPASTIQRWQRERTREWTGGFDPLTLTERRASDEAYA